MSLRSHLCAAALALIVAAGSAVGPAAPVLASDGSVVDPTGAVAYQHDALHDGYTLDPAFTAPLAQAWSRTLAGTVGYPLIDDGRVFVTVAHANGYGDDVEALSLSTGAVLWGPVSIGGTYWTANLAYDGGRVFALNYDGLLTAFDASTGAVDWTRQLSGQWSFTSAPTAIDGTVYAGGAGSGGTLYAVDEATGLTKWTGSVMNGDDSSPAVDGDGVYVSYACEQAYKFALSGALDWHHSTDCEGGGGRTAVLHGGRLYIRDDAGASPAVLDAATGSLVGAFASGPAPAFDQTHMVTVLGGVLTVSDIATGQELWVTTTGTDVTAPLVVNDYVVEGQSDGTVEIRRVDDGALAWSGSAGGSLTGPDEHNAASLTGLAEGDGRLVVPAGNRLTVFAPGGAVNLRITSGPGARPINRTSATFRFTSSVSGPQYVCTIDATTTPCTSPFVARHLGDGSHRFTVALANAIGSVGRTFHVDTVPPVVWLQPFRGSQTDNAFVTARWSGADSRSGIRTYQLRSRRAPIGALPPAWSTRRPRDQLWASLGVAKDSRLCVQVRAEDRAGNWSRWSTSQCVRRI